MKKVNILFIVLLSVLVLFLLLENIFILSNAIEFSKRAKNTHDVYRPLYVENIHKATIEYISLFINITIQAIAIIFIVLFCNNSINLFNNGYLEYKAKQKADKQAKKKQKLQEKLDKMEKGE